ncbi:hypothetical protein SPSIL_036040 [Sporomusa silvacetica DSM 10669]|uniref:DUF2281 domain-containing protein n=1 Tax=Sporomusa silvacetica DSM 10669 TaxID=1123289 RepID=A0ABZ3INW3_9FIRM|nr:DUF2281 domain-containing protein [Sporomusa silvacetica]OZC16925.1 hypothetical protein SPSIL_35240 [Sporomusa silvacetica DSM 10669]
MTLAEKLLKDFEKLPEDKKRQVIDFVDFINNKQQNELATAMDDIISENKEALLELAK